MFLDTAGLLALFHRREAQHAAAVAAFESASRHLTHNYVLAEFVPLATVRGFRRDLILEFSKRVLATPEVEIVWATPVLHEEAIALLQALLDKGYSLCDAISFVLMRKRQISAALTTDRHFEQEGFQRLLSDSAD